MENADCIEGKQGGWWVLKNLQACVLLSFTLHGLLWHRASVGNQNLFIGSLATEAEAKIRHRGQVTGSEPQACVLLSLACSTFLLTSWCMSSHSLGFFKVLDLLTWETQVWVFQHFLWLSLHFLQTKIKISFLWNKEPERELESTVQSQLVVYYFF